MTRQRFHRLLVTIPDRALTLPSKDPNWKNGELLYRMSVAPLIIRSVMKRIRSTIQRAGVSIYLDVEEIAEQERPPMIQIPEYVERDQ